MKPDKIVFHIDQDGDDRDFFTEAFGHEHHVIVYSFSSFGPAMARAATLKPDVIYTDFRVHGVNAVQFLDELDAAHNLEGVPVCIISDTEVPQSLRKQQGRYHASYYVRPDDPADMKALLRSTCLEETA